MKQLIIAELKQFAQAQAAKEEQNRDYFSPLPWRPGQHTRV